MMYERITNFYIRKHYIPDDKKEIYLYGFKLIFSDIINFAIVILLGMIMHGLWESVVYLIALCTVRRYSGGFHAKTFLVCRLSMLITFTIVLALTRLMYESYNIYIALTVNTLSVIAIGVLSPVRHPNKILTEHQRKSNKLKAIITSFIMAVASTLLITAKIVEGVTISITLIAIVVLMIVGMVVQKGGK